ncbi:MAG: alanine racemase [Rhodospirillaceae bacterium]|nr:alanine racemase [Rhodospirillaceae bacterium]
MTEYVVPEHLAGAIVTVDLDAIVSNYQLLRDSAKGAITAAVVKADAYGLGMARVAPALAAAGCEVFFVAHVSEGIQLRELLPDTEIHILNGLLSGAEAAYGDHRLIPVLGSLNEVDRWIAQCGDTPLACDIHIDTGMLRLGLPADELNELAADPARLQCLDVQLVMSHFASADVENTNQSARQLMAFRASREKLPMGRTNLANSAGIFLGAEYRGDVVRPGIALYGCNPTPWTENPMRPVITLSAQILQVRHVAPGETVSYGATHAVDKPSKIATVATGYADGYLRSLSDTGYGFISGIRVPVLGRVTMDMIMLDVSEIAEDKCRPGMWVELIGSHVTVDDVAAAAGTIGHEIMTSIGARYHRRYIGGEN